MSTSTQAPRTAIPPKFDNGQEWHDGLGDVPLSRIIFDPWPGTATEQDLLVFVERDKRLCELVDGTLVEKPVGLYESILAAWLITYINNFIEPGDLGIVTGEAGMMRLSPGRVRIPDVAFISAARLRGHQLSSEPIPSVGPDLAIEVISAGNTVAEMRQKVREYFQAGAQIVWLVYPRTRTVAVFEQDADEPTRVLDEQNVIDGGVVLPGFSLPLSKLFAKLPR